LAADARFRRRSVIFIVRHDMNVPATPDTITRLQHLHEEKKFCEERYYPGAPTEEIRSKCERLVNDFVNDVLGLLRSGTDREGLFTRARALARAFDSSDTEEREKADDYVGETMRILSIEDWTEHV
jgi:Domain of unknown function (DUF4844)